MFIECTSTSTVHGVKYLGERQRHWSEKAFWIIVFLLSVTGCSKLIEKMHLKRQFSPLTSTFDEKSTTVWQIPFPAVTICPETKVKIDYLNYTKEYRILDTHERGEVIKLTNKELIRMDALNHVCRPKFNINSSIELDEIVPTLKEISMKLNETAILCRIDKGNFRPCNEMIDIVTEDGPCFTYNMLDSSEIFRDNVLDDNFVSLSHNRSSLNWTLQGGYTTNDDNTYPKRGIKIDLKYGLTVRLMTDEKDINYYCKGVIQGFKLILHSPGDIPRISKDFIRIPPKMKVEISVEPKMIKTSKDLMNVSLERRNCFYEDEKFLKFFKVYSQSNCELECLTNYTLKACKCVKYSMPRDNQTLICSSSQVGCYRDAETNHNQDEVYRNLRPLKADEIGCNCLPSCTTIHYKYELKQHEILIVDHAYGSIMSDNLTHLKIFL